MPGRGSSQPFQRPLAERVLAWIYTGPVGRLWGTLADVVALWAKWMAGRVRARLIELHRRA